MTTNRHRIYGILGNSLGHSLSPTIFNCLFKKYHLDCTYTTFEIKNESLAKAVDGVRILGIDGLNITHPYKEKIIGYLDKLDRTADATGSANLIKNVKGILTGYNTDLFGIKATLTDRLKINPGNKNICLLGAGGTARSCLNILLQEKAAVVMILNRSTSRAKKMVHSLDRTANSTELFIKNLSSKTIPGRPITFDLIINATSADPKVIGRILHRMVKKGAAGNFAYFDFNYGNRAITKNLPGNVAAIEDGLYMLSAQAARNFLIWQGIKIKVGTIYKYLRRMA